LEGKLPISETREKMRARWTEILLRPPERLTAWAIGELAQLEVMGEALGVSRPVVLVCKYCETRYVPTPRGRGQKYCKRSCKQAAYRERKESEE
jgi:hypothetical protein